MFRHSRVEKIAIYIRQQSGNLGDSRRSRSPPKTASERHQQTQVLGTWPERFRARPPFESTQEKNPPKRLRARPGGGEKFTGSRTRAHRAVGKRLHEAAFVGEPLLDKGRLRPRSKRYGPAKGRQFERFRAHGGDLISEKVVAP